MPLKMNGLTTAIVMALVTWMGVPAIAQTPATPPVQDSAPEDLKADLTGDIQLTRAAIQVRRQALVTAAMDLEPKEADAFWPLYREYRVAMATVNDRFVKLLVAYLDSYETLTDEAAMKMLNEFS